MIKAFFWSKNWAAIAWVGLLILFASLAVQVELTVLINGWYGEFYNILQKPENYSLTDFWDKLQEFFIYAGPYILIATATSFMTRHYALFWREAITKNYIPRWKNVKNDIEGSSQRIQEDAYRWARLVESIGLQVARAIMTLIAFLPILWTLSDKVTLPLLADIPGSLVWVAIAVSLGGLIISWFVGWALPGLEYNNQKAEAAFRKDLVYGEDDKNYINEESLISLFTGVRTNYRRLFLHYGYFDLWLNLYSQCMTVLPYVVMAPSLFAGVITLGVLVQVSNAFSKVHGSFSVFLENWTTINELRSIWKRLKEFEDNLND